MTIRAGGGADVRVVATKRSWAAGAPAPFTLSSAGGNADLQAATGDGYPFGVAPRVDFVVEVPAAVSVQVQSASGDVSVVGVRGPVQAASSSGGLSLTDLGGSVVANTSSGDQHFVNIAGDLTAHSSSGAIQAVGVAQPREVTTSSGEIALTGTFAATTRVESGSGDVTLRVAPASSARIDVTSGSGGVTLRGLSLSGQATTPHSVTGALGAAVGQVEIHTGSGDVLLAAAS